MSDTNESELKFLLSTVEDLNKEIENNPVDFETYNHRAFVYYMMKKYDKALEDVTFSIKLCSTCEYSYLLREMITHDMNIQN